VHEMSLAMRIVDIAVSEAEKVKARVVTEIEIEVGQLAGVTAEALTFCLDAAARGTMAESAVFTLLTMPGQGYCLACEREVPISEFPAQCPMCRGYGVTINAGTELKIRSIQIDDADPEGVL
jgi:hydrogenase nickel incorporation protein HypA/HybF